MALYVGGIMYLIGLILIVMPPKSIPLLDGSKTNVRLGKHLISLLLFSAGIIEIHQETYKQSGQIFLVTSCLIMLVIGLFRIWQEKFSPDNNSEE